jgi:hypothetical protein
MAIVDSLDPDILRANNEPLIDLVSSSFLLPEQRDSEHASPASERWSFHRTLVASIAASFAMWTAIYLLLRL